MTDKKTVTSPLLREEYTVVTHASGLKIYVFPKDLASSYALLATRFGSVDNCFRLGDEREFVTVPDGVAHFLEHKMFENEDGEDTFVKFSRTGANANAYTSFRTTAYLFSCTEELYPSLEILLRSVFSPYFTDENVKKEQGIIAQEIRMGEDDPINAAWYGMLEGLYEKNSVRINIAGTVPSIMKITPDILYRCHRAFYNPANMALCVCGRAELDAVLAVADRVLQGVTPLPVESRIVKEDARAFRSRVEKRMQVARPLCCIGVKVTAISADPEERVRKALALQLIASLGFGSSSEFYRRLYEEGILSPSFDTWYMHTSAFSFFSLMTDTDRPELFYQRFAEYVKGNLLDAIDDESFERCRRSLYAGFIKSFDSTEEIANLLITDFALEGAELFSYPQHIASITAAEVRAVARELFSPDAFTVCTIRPLT